MLEQGQLNPTLQPAGASAPCVGLHDLNSAIWQLTYLGQVCVRTGHMVGVSELGVPAVRDLSI
jgi:hypothetical protein